MYTHTYMYINTHTEKQMYTHTLMYTHTHIHTHTHSHTLPHTHTYTNTHIYSCPVDNKTPSRHAHRVTRYQWVLRHPDFLLQLKHSSFQLFLFLHRLFSQLLLPRQASSVQLKHSSSLEEVVSWITALTDTPLSLEGLFCSVSVGLFLFLMCLFDNIIAPQKHISWMTVLTETPLSLKV